jgi:hypothetical protein
LQYFEHKTLGGNIFFNHRIDLYRFKTYETLVINLCRLPAFSSYVRIPPELWRCDSGIKPNGKFAKAD